MKIDSGLKIRVGLLVVTSLVILAMAILLMGRERRFFENKVSYEIRFSRVYGLRVGAPISLTGVTVGSVESISFPEDVRQNYIVVRVKVVGDVAPRIRKDMIARVRTQGLLGDKFIELSGGRMGSEPVSPGGLIPSMDPIDYEAILGESGDMVQNFTEATSSLKSILKSIEEGKGLFGQLFTADEKGTSAEVGKNLKAASASLRNILSSIEKGKGPLGQMIMSDHEGKWAETANNLHAASASLKNVLSGVESGEGLLGQLLRGRETQQAMIEDLRVGLTQFRRTTEALQKTVEKIARGEGTLGTLIQDPNGGREILTSLSRSAANLEVITRELRQGEGILHRLMTDRVYADRVLTSLDQTTRDLARITGKIERGEGTLGALVNDPELYKDAKETLGSVKGSWLFSISRFFRNLFSAGEESPGERTPRSTAEQGQ